MNPQNLNWPPENTTDEQKRVNEILEKQKEKEKLENDIADLNKRDEQVELNIKLGNPNAEEEKSHLINEVAKLNHQIGEIKSKFPNLDKEYEAIKKAEAEEAERIKQEEIAKQKELEKAEAEKEEKIRQEAKAKEEAERLEKERLEEEEKAKAEAAQKAIDEAKAKEEAEKARKEEIEKNLIENEKKVDETRDAYVEEFLKYKKESKKQGLINKTWDTIRNSLKDSEKKEEIKLEREKAEKENRKDVDRIEREYLQARKKLAESMASKKEDDLRKSGLKEDKIKEELVKYKAEDIIERTIHEERNKVIAAKVEKSSIDKATWKKLVDGYMNLKPSWKKKAISIGLFMTAASTGVVGASMVASYGLAGLGGIKIAQSIASGTVAGYLSKNLDRISYFKKKEDYFKDKKKEFADAYGSDNIVLEKYERELEELEKQERKMNRNKMLLKATVSIAVSSGVGGLTSYGLHEMSLGNTADSASSLGGGHNDTTPEGSTTQTVNPDSTIKADATKVEINKPSFIKDLAPEKPISGNIDHGVTVTADNGHGAIKNLEEIQGKLKAKYGADLSKAPESVKHIVNTDATKLAQEYGQYDPTKVDESAMVIKGDTYTFDEKNGLVFHHNGTATTLEAGKPYAGKMFDSSHTETQAPSSNVENHEVAHSTETQNLENTNPEIDPEDPTQADLDKLAQMENAKTASVPTEELLKTSDIKVGTDHTLTGKEMEEFLANKPKANINNTNINDIDNFRKDIPLTTAKEPVVNYPGSNYSGEVRVATGVISPTQGVYDNGSGIVYQPSMDNAVASSAANNSWTTPVPMTNRAVFENAIMHPVRAEMPIEGNNGFDIDHNPNHFRTGHEVQEAFGKKNVIIDQPDHKTINGIKNENWNTATDEMFKSKGKVFSSPDEYEKEDTMQRLVGHGEQKIEYVPTIDKNAQVIKMDYFRDTEEWDTVKKIPAKYFFDFKEVRADGAPLPQEDIDKLLKAGIIKQSSGGYEFTNKGELERISNVYKEYTPKAERGLHNDMPIGDENLESYIGRMTRVVHTTDNGTLYAVENHGQNTPVVVKTVNGALNNNNIENAPAGTPKANVPTSNNSTATTTNTSIATSKIFPANEQVQGVSRADFDREVERQLSADGKTWATQADKEADLWIWEKFAKITDTLPADQSIDNKMHIAFQSPDANEFIKEDVYARDLMRIDNNIVGKELLELRDKVANQTGTFINPEQGELTSIYVRRLMSKLTNGK